MATENPMRVMAANGIRGGLVMGDNAKSTGGLSSSAGGQDSVAQELGMLLRSHSRLDSIINKMDAAPYRSGSAPPSVGGSLASIGGLFASTAQLSNGIGATKGSDIIDSEHEVRSDPAYLAYYYSRVNQNPRLPPPLVTRENYYLAQRLAAGGYGDARNLRSFDDRSLFSSQSVLPTHNEEPEFSDDERSPMGSLLRQVSEDKRREMNNDGLPGFCSTGLRNRPKSLVDLIQEDFPRTPSPVYSLSRPSSRVANEDAIDGLSRQDVQLTHHFRDSSLAATGGAGASTPGVVLSTSRSTTPNPGVGSRSATPSNTLARMVGSNFDIASSDVQVATLETSGDISGLTNMVGTQEKDGVAESMAALQNLRLSGVQGVGSTTQQTTGDSQVRDYHHKQHSHHNHRPLVSHSNGAANNMYAAAAAAAAMSYMSGNPYTQNLQAYAPHYGLGGYGGMHSALLPAMMANYSSPVSYDSAVAAAAAAAAATLAAGVGVQNPLSGHSSGLDIQQLYRYASQGVAPQSPFQEQLYHHFLQQYTTENARMAATFNETSLPRGYAAGAEANTLESRRPYLNATHAYPVERRVQPSRSFPVGVPLGSNNGSLSPAYYGSPPGIGFVMPYASSPISSPVLPGSPVIPGAFSFRQADPNYVLPSGSGRSTSGGTYAGWQGHKIGEIGEGNALLEELKSNKMRRFELADIAGHVVEFSADQHGSRFIQQKLETVSLEDKACVFKEVLPHALTLMTDVFGNYVIQKFFEHGSPQQRSELADCLVGHVLTLSLQMYGCRVIQKALEVIEVEKQVQLVAELDGQVMRCVRDQNGNHVIQKCIECVPSEHIQFIISAFHGQIVMLSTHPYGCRVIQRILEHSTEEQKLNGMMDEILRAVCTLAQDQYGNYVVQHILEHGKPQEKHEIIRKLAGQIVQMSQHKFASNVVEKCLEFGGRVEREILIKEMLGHTDENEPLQAMMKDQYANYVVQKVLETCDDHHRELLLSRIRVHLHALKKYTYGKHIVARVEKLLAAGERRGARMT